jgi:hypothetical protein
LLAEQAVVGSRRSAEALDTLGAVWLAQGAAAEALARVEEALPEAAGETRLRLLYRRAQALGALGRGAEAETALARAREEAAGAPRLAEEDAAAARLASPRAAPSR